MSEKKMYCYEYPRPAATTDCVIFTYDEHELQVLLVERGVEPYKGTWALPGGFVRASDDNIEDPKKNETVEACAKRELEEETGLRLQENDLRQLGAYSRPDRDPRWRVITIAFYTLAHKEDVRGGDDAAKAQWFNIKDVIAPDGTADNDAQQEPLKLAFDHKQILKDAMKALRHRIHFEPIGFELLPEKFTMRQLQQLYEAILDTRFDRRNFAKKMFHYEILTQLNETTWPTPKREAFLYSWNKDKYDELKEKGFRLEF